MVCVKYVDDLIILENIICWSRKFREVARIMFNSNSIAVWQGTQSMAA